MKYSEITDQTTKGFFALLFKLASGTLETLLEKRKSGLSYDETRDLIITIGEGMYNLQKINIAHRDMKPSNILYERKEESEKQIELDANHEENVINKIIKVEKFFFINYFRIYNKDE